MPPSAVFLCLEKIMTQSDFMKQEEVFELLGKKRTAVWRLIKHHGFPKPVLSHPAKYSKAAVTAWIDSGGISRAS